MSRGRLTTLAALTFALAPAAVAAAPPKPTVVVQAQPVGRVVNDLRDLVRLVSGPKGSDAAKQFQKALEDALGEKGFEGLDINRPLAAYVTVREAFDTSSIVLVVPVTTEKEFVGLLERLKVTAAPVAGKDGLYTLEFVRDPFPHPSHARVANGWAYVCLNGDEVADPANLVPPAEVLDPGEQAHLAIRLYPDRFPAKLLKDWLAEMDKLAGDAKQFAVGFTEPHVGAAFGTTLDEGTKLIRRLAEGLHADAQEVAIRLRLDPLTGTQTEELTVVPRPGTALAKAIASRTPTPNRFAGLVPPDAAAGVVGQLPAFTPEVRVMWAGWLGAMKGEAQKSADDAFKPLLAEAFDGLARAAKAGDTDLAAAVLGPDKDGAFTLVAALAFDDPGKLEKELRALARHPASKKTITLDVDKVGDVAVHKIAVGKLLPSPENGADLPTVTTWIGLLKAFGKDPAVCVAMTPKAVYMAAGPDPVAALKAAVAAKPGPAPAVGVGANPARVRKLVEAAGGTAAGKAFAAAFGTADKRTELFSLTLEGGPVLRVRWVSNTALLARMVLLGEDPPPLPPP
jgi:hypothetical protein